MDEQGATGDPWRLDPARFPQRVDLELNDEAYAALAAISESTGRSIAEVAVEMLARCANTPPFFLRASESMGCHRLSLASGVAASARLL